MDFETIEWVLYALSATVVSLMGYALKTMKSDIDSLEDKIHAVELASVDEGKVRRMITDVVSPIKESVDETKADVKELLRLAMRES